MQKSSQQLNCHMQRNSMVGLPRVVGLTSSLHHLASQVSKERRRFRYNYPKCLHIIHIPLKLITMDVIYCQKCQI